MSGGSVESHDALALALAFFESPGRFPDLLHGRAPLPTGMTELLQVAAGDLPEGAAPPMFVSLPELKKAALFFIDQVLLARNADHYRVMGLAPGADAEEIKEHHRLLMRLFHPDRHSVPDERAEEAAARINRGYAVLRGAETRAAYLETVQPTVAAAPAASPAYPRPVRVSHGHTRSGLPPAFRRNAPQIVLGAVALVAIAAVAVVYVNRVPDGAIGAAALAEGPRSDVVAAVKSEDVVDSAGRVESGGRAEASSGVESSGRVEASSGVDSSGPVQASSRAEASSRVEAGNRAESSGRVESSRRFELPDGVEVTSARRPTIAPLPAPRRERQEAPQLQAEAAPTAAPRASPMLASAQTVAVTTTPTAMQVQPVASRAPAEIEAVRAAPVQQAAPAPASRAETASANRGETAPANRGETTAGSRAEPAREDTSRRAESTGQSASAPAAALAAVAVAVQGNTASAAAEATVEPPTAVLQRFVVAYERGDLEGLMTLFDEDARIERGGRARIRRDYAELFRASEMRSLRLSGLRWSDDGELVRGEGAFIARILRRGEEAMRNVAGSIRVEFVKRGDRLLIIGLFHSVG